MLRLFFFVVLLHEVVCAFGRLCRLTPRLPLLSSLISLVGGYIALGLLYAYLIAILYMVAYPASNILR